MKQLLYRYNPHWEASRFPGAYIERKSLLKTIQSLMSNDQVVFITGLRRIGKTTLMRMLIDSLIEQQNTPPERIFYISLDNYLLREKSLSEIIDKYRQIQQLRHNKFIYVFLDEITSLQDYEIQLKNLYDFGHCKIFASSSNALLIKSKKPFLTGRTRIIEIPPLDYEEYLQFKSILIPKSDSHLHEKYFMDFLKTGGIPEYVKTDDIAYIQDLVDDIIYKDIVAQYQLKNPKLMRDFFLLLMERSGKQFSINKIAGILKISTERAKRYLEYFAESYLIYLVEREGKTNERLLAPKKIYASDLGIRNVFTGFRDIGSLFENYVYLKIRHLKPRYLYKNQSEIDFITADKKLIEVKFKNAVLSEKQQLLFDSYKADKKFIINHFSDIEKVLP